MNNPQYWEEFEREVNRLLVASRPDPGVALSRLRAAETERDNLLKAIRAGIITPGTKAALEAAEDAVQQATQLLTEIEEHTPSQILPRAREIFWQAVEALENVDDTPAAREAIKCLIGEEI